MSDIFVKLLSDISGAHNLEACLKKCDITNLSDIININDRCLMLIEKCIKEKCKKIPENDRLGFIEDVFIKRPEIFKFAPGVRERILNTVKALDKVYKNCEESEINQYGLMLLNQKQEYETSVPVDRLNRILQQNKTFFGLTALPNSISLPSNQLKSVSSPNLQIKLIENINRQERSSCQLRQLDNKENSIPLKKEKIVSNEFCNVIINLENEDNLGKNWEQIDDLSILNKTGKFVNSFSSNIENLNDSCLSPISILNSSQKIVSQLENTPHIAMTTVRDKPNKNQKYCSADLSETIANNLRTEFINCHLSVGKDFDVIVSKSANFDKPKIGKYVCYICKRQKTFCKSIRFSISKTNLVNYNSINKHLAKHFYPSNNENLTLPTKRKFRENNLRNARPQR